MTTGPQLGPVGMMKRLEADLESAQKHLEDFKVAVFEIGASPLVGRPSDDVLAVLSLVEEGSEKVRLALADLQKWAKPYIGDGEHQNQGTVIDEALRNA